MNEICVVLVYNTTVMLALNRSDSNIIQGLSDWIWLKYLILHLILIILAFFPDLVKNMDDSINFPNSLSFPMKLSHQGCYYWFRIP